MALKETIDISQLSHRLNKATDDMVFAGVVALTRTAKHAQQAIRDQLPDVFNIRNKWTLQGIRITPATKQNQESEVYSKDWYMPVHEEGGDRKPNARGFWIPVGIRDAVGVSKKELIPRWASPKNLLKGKRKIERYGNKPFYAKARASGVSGIWVRTDKGQPMRLLYLERTEPIKIPKRPWFWHEVVAAYDKYLEQEYNAALLEAWMK